jgi:hypothetical protein
MTKYVSLALIVLGLSGIYGCLTPPQEGEPHDQVSYATSETTDELEATTQLTPQRDPNLCSMITLDECKVRFRLLCCSACPQLCTP